MTLVYWFSIADQYDANRWYETMYGRARAGETHKTSLEQHDIDSALVMYGRR